MQTRKDKLLWATILGVIAGVLYTTIREYIFLLSHRNGVALPNGKPLGGDFICFYLAGKLYLDNPQALYDFQKHLSLQQEFFSESNIQVGFLPFIYPPLVAAFFSLFANLDFETAAISWLVLSSLIGFLAICLVLLHLPGGRKQKFALLLAALAYVPFSIDCLAGGQTSAFGLLILAGLYVLEQKKKFFLAGFLLSFAYYKPPLFALYLLFAVLGKRWRFLKGFALGAALLISGTLLAYGPSETLEYVVKASSYQHGAEMLPGYIHSPSKGAGVMSTLLSFVPKDASAMLYLGIVIFLVLRSGPYTRNASGHPAGDPFHFSLFASASLFGSLWLMLYDYALLLVPMLIVSCHFKQIPVAALRWAIGVIGVLLFFEYCTREFPIGSTMLKIAPILLFVWVILLQEIVRSRSVLRRKLNES